MNEETACGWKAFTKASLNTPFDYGLVLTMNRYGNQITQIAFNPYMGGCGEICIRHKYDDVWREWEYVNPPMLLGVEYRTTERFFGKPVYTIAFNFGALPNASTAYVGIPSPAAGFTTCVSAFAHTHTGSLLNVIDSVSSFSVWIKTNEDYSDEQAYITIKYTKD